MSQNEINAVDQLVGDRWGILVVRGCVEDSVALRPYLG